MAVAAGRGDRATNTPNPRSQGGGESAGSRRDAFPERAGMQGCGCRRSGPESSGVPAELTEPGRVLESLPLALALRVGLGKPHVVLYQVLRPALGSSAQERHGPIGVGPEEATKMG